MHAYSLVSPTLPQTQQLLMEGGDARISPGKDGTTNKYGCSTNPDPHVLAFGSSTASSISERSYLAADKLRSQLLNYLATEESHITYNRELNRIRQELLTLCEIDSPNSVDIIFAASGTDIHLISAQLVSETDSSSTLIIMMDANETGRGVPNALSGKHFSEHSALGHKVQEGNTLDGIKGIEVATVSIRLQDGSPRKSQDIDFDVENLVGKAIKNKQKVLIVIVDVSKTGMIAPSVECVLNLHQRFFSSVDVLVDACQFRICNTTLHGYLNQGFMVAVTGSKFLTGPTFSGALFIPKTLEDRLSKRKLPKALSAYSSRAEWPSDWAATEALINIPNFGLLLRWEAALAELKAFRTIDELEIKKFLKEFANVIQQRLSNDPTFLPLSVPTINRQPLVQNQSWDQIPTILPFILCDPHSREPKPLSVEKTLKIYQLLQKDLTGQLKEINDENNNIAALKCQLGQPVSCGDWNGVSISALRICASTRLIVEAIENNERKFSKVIEEALAVIDKLALLANMDLLGIKENHL